MKRQDLNQENDFFSVKRIDAVVTLTFKGKRLLPITSWSTKTPILEYLDLGLVPKGGGAYFLEERLGHCRACEILLSDKTISAHEALELGLVNEVIPRDALDDAALKKAQYFSQQPASSLRGTKKLLNFHLKDLKEYLDFENRTLVNIFTHKVGEKSLCRL